MANMCVTLFFSALQFIPSSSLRLVVEPFGKLRYGEPARARLSE
jgi:hypothetical protein